VGVWLNRPRRVLLALALIWVVAIFDLGYTLGEYGTFGFAELNPVAAQLLRGPMYLIMIYKFGLLGLSTVILLLLRHRLIAELGCWFLLTAMVYLAIRWYHYFDTLLRNYVDPVNALVGTY